MFAAMLAWLAYTTWGSWPAWCNRTPAIRKSKSGPLGQELDSV